MKVESGKWKVSNKFMIMIILACALVYAVCVCYISFPRTYHYQDNIYVRIMNVKTKRVNRFDIALAGNKNFTNCKEVGKQYYKDNYFDTKRTMKELENSCVKISVFGASGSEILQIKRILQEDATRLVIVKE